MNSVFSGVSADDVWKQAMLFIQDSCEHGQQSRLGNTFEELHAIFHIQNPRQRWVISRRPILNPAFAIAEIFWILAGDNISQLVNYWNPKLPKFAGYGKKYHGAYGYRIRKQFGFDQLIAAYNALNANQVSRQVIIQIWDPRIDFPSDKGEPVDPDIPCNICSLLKVRNGKLEWFQVMRSNDIYLGTPYNFIQFTTIQEILAGWLNLEIGEYTQLSDSLHIYENNTEEVSIADNVPSLLNNDALSIPKEKFDEIFSCIYTSLKKLSNKTFSKKEYDRILNLDVSEQSYKNLLLIAAADSARRRGWKNEMHAATKQCTNEMILYAWTLWEERSFSK